MTHQRQRLTRRQEYAQATRRAIVDAARQLFSQRGYFSTKVDDIAALARVAPATVYAVSGGKHELLCTLIEIWSDARTVAINDCRSTQIEDPVTVLRQVATVCRRLREDFDDIIRAMLLTAPHDQAVSEVLATTTAQCRQAFRPVAQHLSDLDALRDGLDVNQAVDVLWFYFGFSGFFTLRDENGWSYERAERWLCEEASRAMLRDRSSETNRNETPSEQSSKQ
ncbi:MAG TPA: TetR/AcrR family transcriptional regulator [Chthoniobacterales bacterium]|nr:TetR/AcrR family transcriptional regulator [Chthoniobacterales bacterium]